MAKSDIAEILNKRNNLEKNLIESLIPPSDHENYNEIELSVTAGAGGEEAMLFSKELFQMYQNYALFKGWPFQVLSSNESDQGKNPGMKSYY